MLDLRTVLEEQQSMEKLCQPVDLYRHEIYSPNDNYGHAYAMKRYANYPVEEPIMATFPHGIYFRDQALPLSEVKAGIPSALCFPPYISTLWRKKARGKNIVPFASPVYYAISQFQSEIAESDRRGSLFLPKHSTAAVDIQFDTQAVLEELEKLPDEFKPVTVCVHWQDAQKGQAKLFRDLGFDVVTAGHFTDYNYMFRWLHLVSRHRLLVGCGLGSALFYAVMAGVPFLLLKENPTLVEADQFKRFDRDADAQYSSSAVKRMADLYNLFGELTEKPTREQIAMVDYFTSKELIRTPKELNQLFRKLRKKAGKR